MILCVIPGDKITERGSRKTTQVPARKLVPIRKKNEGGGTRTLDLRIKSPLLYQLSYAS